MFKLFEIKDGKFTPLPDVNPKKIKSAFIATIIIFLISFLSGLLEIGEKELWKLYISIIQHFGLNEKLPEIKDSEKKLESKIELEVDRSIKEYQDLTKGTEPPIIPPPRRSEKPVDTSVCYTDECRALGGEMRICSPWVDNCPKE